MPEIQLGRVTDAFLFLSAAHSARNEFPSLPFMTESSRRRRTKMSRNKDNGIDLKASRAKKSARQFAHGGHPAHKILPEQAVKNNVPPPAMDDYTMMMIQAMEGRS